MARELLVLAKKKKHIKCLFKQKLFKRHFNICHLYWQNTFLYTVLEKRSIVSRTVIVHCIKETSYTFTIKFETHFVNIS